MREYWKYGASVGVSGTPSAFINGVKIAEMPSDECGWTGLLNTLINEP